MHDWPHFKLNIMNEIFHFFKFRDNFSELGEICFPLKNEILKPLKIFRIPQNLLFLTWFLIYLNTKKIVAIKKKYSLKNRTQNRNPKFNILCKIAFTFYKIHKIPIFWSSKINKAILVHSGGIGLLSHTLIF